MSNISLKSLLEAENFKARSKETGKLVHFKSKDSYDAALKAGSHEDPTTKKDSSKEEPVKGASMFGADYAKSRGGEAPKDKETPSEPQKVTSVPKVTEKIKKKIENWTEKEKAFFERNEGAPGSELRRSLGQTLKDKAKGALKAIKKGFKHEVEEFKEAGKGVQNFFSGKPLSKHEQKALKAVAFKVVTTALFGAALGGTAHGAAYFAKHVAMEFIPHIVGETILKGVTKAAVFADAEGEAEMDANMVKFTELIAKGLEEMEITPEMMEQMVDSYNEKKANESTIKNISLKGLIEAEDFKARSKETGKLVHFKSKDAYQAALKAGSHEDPKAQKGGASKGAAKPNDMFGGDYAKDRGSEPKSDGMETVKSIAASTGLRAQAVAGWADENGVNLSKVSDALNSKKLKPMDFMTAVSGNPGNKYAKDIIAKYSQGGGSKSTSADTPKDDVDISDYSTDGTSAVLYKGKKVGDYTYDDITDEFTLNTKDGIEVFDTQKDMYKYIQKNKDEPKKDEPTSKPKEARKGNPNVNKEAKKKAEEFGITPQKLGKDGYQKAMYQAAVEALTDANFHDEARELISKIEGKPEWAKRVNYPSMDDPKYKEKMADIRTNGVDSSEYWGGEDGTHEFARKVAASSGWDGVDAADGIAFTLRMNGFHKEADMIQSVFDDKPYMREESTKLKSMIKK
jgi:hypothetical protein